MGDKIKKVVVVLLGNALYAAGVTLFIIPNGLITGGTTGIALVVNHFFHIPVAVFVAIFNILMFILGALVLGKVFALTTVISTFCYPIILAQFQQWYGTQPLTNDATLATIFAGLFIGFGIGLVIRVGSSTGGMDIPPLVLNKKFGLPVSGMLYGFDVVILAFQMLFSQTDRILYGMLLVLIYTFVLDKVLVIGKSQTQVKIVSQQYEEINKAIQEKLDRGTTLFKIEGGHLRKESYAVLAIVSARELTKLSNLVTSIDPTAFMVISKVNEVHGRGFTLHKMYQ